MKKLKKYILCFILLTTLFSIFKIISCYFPSNKIESHITESLSQIEKEGSYYTPFGDDSSFNYRLDGFSDAIILNIAQNRGSYVNENNIKKAFEDSYYSKEKSTPTFSLTESNINKSLLNNTEYSRYWHGIQTIIRPLLTFFNYSEIRMILSIVILILIVLMFNTTNKNIGINYSIALTFSFTFININLNSLSIQFSCMSILSLISIILVSKSCINKNSKNFPLNFFIIGSLSSYFDLLTFPLITFGLPIIVILLYMIQNNKSFKECVKIIFTLSIMWIIGYLLTFLSKWIISSIVLGKNVMISSLEQFFTRSDITGIANINKIDTIKVNMQTFFTPLLIKFLIIIFIIWFGYFIINKCYKNFRYKYLLILVISLSPCVWYITLTQHSFIHVFFTHKNLIITLFSFLSFMLITTTENITYKNLSHTFVVLAYKKSKYLEECIKSVLNQSLKTNVVIATSTPNAYIKKLSKKYNLKVIEHENSKGIADDFNFAAKCIDSDLITIAHQDDIYDEEYAKNVVNYYKKYSDSTIIFTDYYEIRNNKKNYINKNIKIKKFLLIPLKIKQISNLKFIKRNALRFGNAICCPSVTFCKKNIMINKIFTSNFTSNMDWLAWERISKLNGRFVYIERPLMGHRVHSESTTTKIIKDGNRTNEDYEMFLKFWPKKIAKLINKIYKNSEKSNNVE